MAGAGSRRSLFGALAALLVTCQSQVSPQSSHADPDPPPPVVRSEPRAFDPDVVAVSPSSPLGLARAQLDAGNFVEARRLAETAATGSDRDALLWVAARAAERAGDIAAAVTSWNSIDAQGPLGPWARLAAASASLPRDAEGAATLVAPLLEYAFPGRPEAHAIHARAGARREDGEARLRAAIALATGSTRSELERALAELLASRDDLEARVAALELLRGIDARSPQSRAARDAITRAGEILATLPAEARRTYAVPSIDQQIARADALAAAMDHQGAETAYAAVALRLGSDRARRCEVRLGQGRAMYRRRARREAAALLSALAEDCREESDDVRAWARYFAAKSYAGVESYAEAIAQYDVLAEELPAHRLADDALINAARLAEDERADAEGMRVRLTRILDSTGTADMRGEARFLLAWNARREGRLGDALTHLDAALAEGSGAAQAGDEGAEDVRGRAAYWRGRILEASARPDEAAAQYEAIVRALPLAYYAQHAHARLAALDARRAAALAPTPSAVPALLFDHRDALDQPAFVRALALLRVGEVASAERELRAAGLDGDDADPEALWLTAALLDRAGSHGHAMELARRRLRDGLMTSAPVGRARALWRIAYPRAYHPLIDDVAALEGVPSAFVRAIAREESSFRPDAVSVAHAYGLMQIIRPTAQRIARPLGLPSDPAALRTADVNVRIGRYVSGLRRRYDPQYALVPAAYNAGEAAVDRWLRERGDRSLDEFIEEIPYDETRRYTRRVLQTWGIYAALDDGQLPLWPAGLPRRDSTATTSR